MTDCFSAAVARNKKSSLGGGKPRSIEHWGDERRIKSSNFDSSHSLSRLLHFLGDLKKLKHSDRLIQSAHRVDEGCRFVNVADAKRLNRSYRWRSTSGENA
jgi:hypothetical protein